MKPLLSRSGKNQHCHSLPNVRFGIQSTQAKGTVSYLRAKQLSMPDLPKNQQHPMNRIMDKPAVAHSNAWKKLAVRVTEVLSWLWKFLSVGVALTGNNTQDTYFWSKPIKAILCDSDSKKPVREDPRRD